MNGRIISIVNEPPGRLSITTGSTPSVCRIRDWQLNTVGEGVAPLTVELPPGMYLASAAAPRGRRISRIAIVKTGESTPLDLSKDPASDSDSALASYRTTLQELLRKAKETVGSSEDEPWLPRGSEVPIAIRFLSVPDWNRAEILASVPVEAKFSKGCYSIDFKTLGKPVFFVQVATAEHTPVCVAVPAHGLRRPSSRLVVSVDDWGINTELRFKDPWASVVADYLQTGRFTAVRELLSARLATTNALEFGISAVTNPTTYNLLPSLLVKFSGKDLVNSVVSGIKGLQLSALEYLNLADIHLFLGELAAQRGDRTGALNHFVKIGPQDIPVFTIALSQLTSRIRQYWSPADAAPRYASHEHRKIVLQLARPRPFGVEQT